jgi:hypothetical protein
MPEYRAIAPSAAVRTAPSISESAAINAMSISGG